MIIQMEAHWARLLVMIAYQKKAIPIETACNLLGFKRGTEHEFEAWFKEWEKTHPNKDLT